MEVTYIEFIFPGSFFPEASAQPVSRRELPETIPGQAAGYRFFARTEANVDGETLIGKPKDHSGWTYFGKEFSAAQVEALEGDRYRILKSNIRINGYTRMVQTIYGNWYQLEDGDRVVADADAECAV